MANKKSNNAEKKFFSALNKINNKKDLILFLKKHQSLIEMFQSEFFVLINGTVFTDKLNKKIKEINEKETAHQQPIKQVGEIETVVAKPEDSLVIDGTLSCSVSSPIEQPLQEVVENPPVEESQVSDSISSNIKLPPQEAVIVPSVENTVVAKSEDSLVIDETLSCSVSSPIEQPLQEVVENPPVEESQISDSISSDIKSPPQEELIVPSVENKEIESFEDLPVLGDAVVSETRCPEILKVLVNLTALACKVEEFQEKSVKDSEYAKAYQAASKIHQGLLKLTELYVNKKLNLSEYKSRSEQFIKEQCQDELEVLNSPRGWKAKTIVTNIVFALSTLLVGYAIGVLVTGRFSVFQPQTDASKRMDDLTQSINSLTVN